jgi:hypothetical protein
MTRSMKKSAAVQLTLVSALAASGAACTPDRPDQALRGYCDPTNSTVCDSLPLAGYVPTYVPTYHRGIYYDEHRVGRQRPGGPVIVHSYGGSGSGYHGGSARGVGRGGFGGIGGGRGAGA